MTDTVFTEARFQAARIRVLSDTQEHTQIGMLSEKTLHRMLKFTVEPCEERHEQKVLGRVADVFSDGHIYEIQTRTLFRLRPKLQTFLSAYPTSVIYPLPHVKHLRWIDPETGEIGPRRRSPKVSTPFDAIPELYRLSDLLSHENLTVYLVFLDVEEYRYLDGYGPTRKHRSTRAERMAEHVHSSVRLSCADDYRSVFLPSALPSPFTVKEYAKAARIKPRWAYTGIRMLMTMGIVSHVGMRGREYLYAPSAARSVSLA